MAATAAAAAVVAAAAAISEAAAVGFREPDALAEGSQAHRMLRQRRVADTRARGPVDTGVSELVALGPAG